MTPNNWLGIIAFFFFIAPGLHYDSKVVRKKVKPRETVFAEISRVALVSTLCSVPAFLFLGGFAAICAWQDWKLLPDPTAWIKQGTGYLADNILKVSITFLAVAAVALVIADLAFWWNHRKDPGNITFESTWREVLRWRAPEGTVPHARVSMKDGAAWTGRVAYYSPDMELADREIVLSPPIYRTPKPDSNGNRQETVDYPEVFEHVVLKDSEIAYLAVKYEPDTDPPEAPPSRWWQRLWSRTRRVFNRTPSPAPPSPAPAGTGPASS
ncbi:DUF6338 family protein [Nocardia sp. NPDC057440]|uniref:DUF6338 family protein n=1 Tax=Nocardia sp. NPDC057440 TaxID=3346134 RepID=UPI00367312D5